MAVCWEALLLWLGFWSCWLIGESGGGFVLSGEIDAYGMAVWLTGDESQYPVGICLFCAIPLFELLKSTCWMFEDPPAYTGREGF